MSCITVDLHIHNEPGSPKLDEILALLRQIFQGVTKMGTTFDDLQTAVSREGTVIESVKALVLNIKGMLDAANTSNDPKIKAVIDQIVARADQLGAFVVENTPAAPPTP